MIGAIIGDIVGSRFEFHNTDKYDFELFTDQNSYTDDTICTVAIMDALLDGKSYKRCLLDWCHKYPHPMGAYGASFETWLNSEHPEPYYSYGNGSAMRVSPVGWFFDDMDKVREQAAETAKVSHDHPEGIKGAQAVAYGIWYLRTRHSIQDFARVMDGIYPGFQEKDYPVGVFDETCQGTVPVALQIVCQATSFEDAIRRAIAHGGDSDTLGAITGSLAEARFVVPEEMITFALGYLPDDMKAVVKNFYHTLFLSQSFNE